MTGTAGEISGDGYIRDDLDFYIEPDWAVELLLDAEPFKGNVYDPACGSGTIVRVCQKRGMEAYGTDILSRGSDCEELDFLAAHRQRCDNIICNPPYRDAQRFAEVALSVARHKVALLVQAKFLFSQRRYALFTTFPPSNIFFLSTRPSMPPGERWLAGTIKAEGGKVDYLWCIWNRRHTYEHRTEARWLIRASASPSPSASPPSPSPPIPADLPPGMSLR